MDMDYSQYDFPSVMWCSLPDWEIAVKIVAFVPILVVGLLGNALMVTIIVRNRALQTPTNLLLANMSAADFLTLAICPVLFMYNNFYQEFRLGNVGCLAEGFLEGAFLVTAVFNLCAVSYDRLTAIVLPTETRLNIRGAKIVMVFTWLAGGVFATPLAIFRFYKERQWRNYLETFCSENPSILPTYWHILIGAIVWLPLAVMVICYSAIMWKLDRYERQALRREHPFCVSYKKRVAKTLFLVVLSFVALRVPFTALIFIRNQLLNQQVVNQVTGSFAILWYVSHYLIFVNAAVNPLIYGLTNDNFRRAYSQTPLLSYFCSSRCLKEKPSSHPVASIRPRPPLQPRSACLHNNKTNSAHLAQQAISSKRSNPSEIWMWLNQTRFRGNTNSSLSLAVGGGSGAGGAGPISSKATMSTHIHFGATTRGDRYEESTTVVAAEGTYRPNADVYM